MEIIGTEECCGANVVRRPGMITKQMNFFLLHLSVFNFLVTKVDRLKAAEKDIAGVRNSQRTQ